MTDKATRERLKREAAERGAQVPAPAPVPAAEPPAPKQPGAPPASVMCSCGHTDQNRPCGKCRAARTLAKKQKRDAKKEVNRANPRNVDAGRLPNAAAFVVVYDAAAKKWEGSLRVGDVVLLGEASGVFKLLANLDAAYRASLKPSAPIAESAAP